MYFEWAIRKVLDGNDRYWKFIKHAIYEYFSSKNLNDCENVLPQQYFTSFSSWESLLQYGIYHREFKAVDIHSVFDLIIFSYKGVGMYIRLMKIDDNIPKRIIKQIKSIILLENT